MTSIYQPRLIRQDSNRTRVSCKKPEHDFPAGLSLVSDGWPPIIRLSSLPREIREALRQMEEGYL